MSRKLPLIFGHKEPQEEATLGTATPKEYNDLQALPTLKEKLEYFNKNICTLAISGKRVVYVWGDDFKEEMLEIYDSDFSTEAERAIFEPLREQEIARLLDELGRWKTYGEKLAYIITQPGFNLYGLTITDRRNEYIIDLTPNKRSPEEIAQFNWLSERVFRKSCSPKNHKHFRFHEQRKQIEAQLKNALDPARVVAKYLKQIEAYTGYPKPYISKHVKTEELDMEEYLKKLSLTNGEYNLKAKQVFLKLVEGDFQIQPDVSKKPIYYWDWDVLKHGEQIYQLYKWLKTEANETPDPYPLIWSSNNSITFRGKTVFFPFDSYELGKLLGDLQSALSDPNVCATDLQEFPITIFEQTELKHYPDLAGFVRNIVSAWVEKAELNVPEGLKKELFRDFLKGCEERIEPKPETRTPIAKAEKIIPKITENAFCKAMPIEAARQHFSKLKDTHSKNGKPFLTEQALESFIQRAFGGNSAVPKQLINLNPNKEKAHIYSVFYDFYSTAVKEWEPSTQCRDRYIQLLTENFEGWDFKKVKNNFTKVPKKPL